MEFIVDGNQVRLRNLGRGGYLHADVDGVGVVLQPPRASIYAAWTVHVAGPHVHLYSAATARYLAASGQAPGRGHRGLAALQLDFVVPNAQAITWEVVQGPAEAAAVVLRNPARGGYLRANGKYLRWNRGVSVGGFRGGVSLMAHWVVEPIGALPLPEVFPAPDQNLVPAHRGNHVAPVRQIFFARTAPDGTIDENEWEGFEVDGRCTSVLDLRLAIQSRMEDVYAHIMCIRSGRYGRFVPLLTTFLPTNVYPLYIPLVPRHSPAAAALRYPDVDA